MSDRDRRVHGPDRLNAVTAALREEIPLRPEWRRRLLDEIAALPTPERGGRTAGGGVRRRSLVLNPALALAAAMGFMMLGAGSAYLLLRDRTQAGVSLTAAVDPALQSTGAGADSLTSDPLVTVRFTLEAPEARRVALVGDFNQWNAGATPMRRARDGQPWTIEVGLRPGRHAYAFVVDDNVVADPAAPSAVGEDFGVRSSVVLVSERMR